jgi:hypothetical protein
VDPQIETNVAAVAKPIRAESLWRVCEEKSRNSFGGQTLNARVVEFIAKAGLSSRLRDSTERAVFKVLDRQIGFAGAMLLTPHKEPRRILVLSFWTTERNCRENEWESAKEVQKEVGPLIDALSRVRTYEADFSEPLQTGQSVDAAQPC